jgi:hypothetical protein
VIAFEASPPSSQGYPLLLQFFSLVFSLAPPLRPYIFTSFAAFSSSPRDLDAICSN